MPLTKTGKEVMGAMHKKYGKRAKEVFYASINKGVAGSSKWHRSPDTYNDTALSEAPPREKYTRDPEVGSDAQPRAVGVPAGVRVADGAENLRTAAETRDAGIVRAGPGKAQGRRPAGVVSFTDDRV